VVSRFVRRVRTASGSVAVQVVTRQGRVWHNGQTGGYTSNLGLDLEHHRAVIVLSDVAKDVTELGNPPPHRDPRSARQSDRRPRIDHGRLATLGQTTPCTNRITTEEHGDDLQGQPRRTDPRDLPGALPEA
jgi:hypothetical protein